MYCRRLLIALVALAAILFSPGDAVRRAGAEPEPAASKAPDAKSVREQTIYVPYDKLRNVFEQHGRGVFLPYEKFQELWQAARAKTQEPEAGKPPVGALITQTDNEVVVGKDAARLNAVVTIDVLAEGWSEVPLRLSDAAITSAVLGDEPARILSGGPERGHRVLLFKKEKAPQRVQLRLECAKAIAKAPGQNSVQFEAPQAAVGRWKVRIPEKGVKVSVQPMIAATEEVPSAPNAAADETVLLAFVGAAPVVRIEWTPKAEGASGMTALASVQTEQQVWLTESVARTKVRLNYTISRAELKQLVIETPADQKVAGVFDPNVRQWSVKTEGKTQRLTLQLFEPAKTAQEVLVELEKFAGEAGLGAFTAPVVKAVDAGRQQGVLVVDVDPSLRAEAARATGLMQLDRADLPAALSGGRWAFAYRYAAVPFELVMNVEKVQPQITADALLEATIEPERLTLEASIAYSIQRAGVFRFDLESPRGFEVVRVVGMERDGAAAAQVDSHRLEGPAKDRLVVQLTRKAMGKVGLRIEWRKELHEPALSAPGEKPAEIAIPLPRPTADSVQRSVGRLVVYAPESLRVNPSKSAGLRSVSFAEAFAAAPSGEKPGGCRPALAFALGQERQELTLEAQRRTPQTTVDQVLQVRVDDLVVKYQCALFYHVKYSGVKSFRLDVPKSLIGRLRNVTRGVREKEIQPPPKDVAPDYVAWRLTGDAEFLGDVRIDLVWEDDQSVGKLEVGKSATFPVPRLAPREVDRAWGQIAIARAESIDVQAAENSKGLRPIDPQHDLLPAAGASGVARAFEFQDEWSLSVVATRYQAEEVKRTSVERAVVQVVLTSGNLASVRARYRVRSARQRLEIQLPEAVEFDAQPVRIEGRPVTLERGQAGRFFIPLVNRNPEQSFLLELRYTQPERLARRFDLPYFVEGAAVQKVYLCVYLPDGRTVLGKCGPWTDEFVWRLELDFNWTPAPNVSEAGLNAWLGGDGSNDGSGGVFQTDRRLYLFSALQPLPAPDGSLGLTIATDNRVTLAIVAALGLVGVLLTWTRASTRVMFLGLLVVAIVLLGQFWPFAAHAILGGRFAMAAIVVLGVWMMAGAYRVARRTRVASARGQVEMRPLDQPSPPSEADIDLLARAKGAPPVPPALPPTSQGGPSHE